MSQRITYTCARQAGDTAKQLTATVTVPTAEELAANPALTKSVLFVCLGNGLRVPVQSAMRGASAKFLKENPTLKAGDVGEGKAVQLAAEATVKALYDGTLGTQVKVANPENTKSKLIAEFAKRVPELKASGKLTKDIVTAAKAANAKSDVLADGYDVEKAVEAWEAVIAMLPAKPEATK